ncbi:hypothetical protein SERLA73DRAFT_188648, partial [Serpula lacrymans var. lacrymans S7.3]
MQAAHLPPEIWLHIFRWATSPLTSGSFALTYEPFQIGSEDVLKATLQVRYAIVRVCWLWRALAMDLLYEDVRVRHGMQALVSALRGDEYLAEGNGRWVRRLELPYAHTNTATSDSSVTALNILKHCPSLEVLTRPFPSESADNMRFEFSAGHVVLTSLKRLEWWHHNGATRSGGINSLYDVLKNAPNLQYLAVGGSVLPRFISVAPLCLTALSTLRLRKMNHLFIRQLCRWDLPSLEHVIVDVPETWNRALEGFWETFGDRLRTVELGQSVAFCVSDQVTLVLQGCPRLKELNYYVFFTSPVRSTFVHSSISCVRLHAHPNLILLHDGWDF